MDQVAWRYVDQPLGTLAGAEPVQQVMPAPSARTTTRMNGYLPSTRFLLVQLSSGEGFMVIDSRRNETGSMRITVWLSVLRVLTKDCVAERAKS
jgi:hypothetical protein